MGQLYNYEEVKRELLTSDNRDFTNQFFDSAKVVNATKVDALKMRRKVLMEQSADANDLSEWRSIKRKIAHVNAEINDLGGQLS